MFYEKILAYLIIISDKNKIRLEKLVNLWNINIKKYVNDLKIIPKSINVYKILKYDKVKITFDDVLKSKGIQKEHSKLDIDMKKQQKNKKEPKEKRLCPYSFSKGELKSSICGTKVKEGNTYCSKHKKYENIIKKEKKIIPTLDHALVKWNETDRIVQTYRSLEKIKKENWIIKIHPILKKYVHPESGMVFHSFEKREVIGKIKSSDAPFWENKTDEIIDLSINDIEICKKYGFPIYTE